MPHNVGASSHGIAKNAAKVRLTVPHNVGNLHPSTADRPWAGSGQMGDSIMSKPMAYGSDVSWEAGEIVAFRIFNDICREQALAIFAASRDGLPCPASRPAAEIAAEARRLAVA
jgi:hypothetical protein